MTWLILPRLSYDIGAFAATLSGHCPVFAVGVAKMKIDLPADFAVGFRSRPANREHR
jgi:hypothetical protein